MAVWLLYATQAAAQADVATINARSNFTGNITTTWAVPMATADGKWAIPAPDDTAGLTGASGTPNWPVVTGP